MSKIARDAKAFARRVRMGSARVWLLVEGRVHDRAFYDRLLEAHPLAPDEYSVRLVEQIALNGHAAGGKSASYALHDWFAGNGLLKQTNTRGDRYIGFAVDRDFEDFEHELRTSPNIIYTVMADVEAEILINGDIRRALCSTFSLSRGEVDRVLPSQRTIPSELAHRWRDWITLRALSIRCAVSSAVRYGALSQVNEAMFGAADAEKVAEIRDEIAAAHGESEWLRRFTEVTEHVEATFAAGSECRLVKGRWIERFAHHLIAGVKSPREANVPDATLTKTCLETIDFQGAWTSAHHAQLARMLAS